jgi:predicted ATPase
VIKRVRLHNFKSFADTTVDLAPISFIFGANAVGKSNLFDALRFLRYMGEGRTVRDAIEGHTSFGPAGTTITGIRGGSQEITRLGSGSSEFELEIAMSIGREEFVYRIHVDAAKYRVMSEELRSVHKGKHPGPYVFSTNPETGPLDNKPDDPGLNARFYKETRGLNPKRGFSAHESILSQFTGRAAESRVNEEAAEIARTELASIQPLELRPEVLRQYSALGRFELGEHGENFAAIVWNLLGDADSSRSHADDSDAKEAADRYDAIVAWLSELTPHPVTRVEAQPAPTGEVIFALKESPFDQSITARSLSDGTLRFAALAFALLAFGGRRTLLIEEVENGINPARLNLLVRMLEQTAAETKDVQVLASTHSPTVLDYASERTLNGSIVIGWDVEAQASHVERMGALLRKVDGVERLSDLQVEGWLQFAADR